MVCLEELGINTLEDFKRLPRDQISSVGLAVIYLYTNKKDDDRPLINQYIDQQPNKYKRDIKHLIKHPFALNSIQDRK